MANSRYPPTHGAQCTAAPAPKEGGASKELRKKSGTEQAKMTGISHAKRLSPRPKYEYFANSSDETLIASPVGVAGKR